MDEPFLLSKFFARQNFFVDILEKGNLSRVGKKPGFFLKYRPTRGFLDG
jgi:hypothetical protein